MKKLSVMLAAMLVLSMLVCSAAFAATTLMPMPTGIDPAHLEKASCYARILGYNELENTLTVELIAPEIFSLEILALQEGDSIYTGGKEVLIESIPPTDWCASILFNDGDLFFFQERDLFYRMETEDDYFWNVVASVECPVMENLLFLDYVNETSGDMLELPKVLTADELTAKLLAEQASEDYHIGLSANNACVVFDGDGDLAIIYRFYVPWQ